MSLKRTLTTQERVDLAVKAGYWADITEFVRMHDGQGATGAETGNGVISIAEPSGTPKVYSALPGYAFPAIDCYLNTFGIPLDVEVETPAVSAPKASMLSMAHLQYANHCHEQAAYFESQSGKTCSGRLKEDAEYAAAHTAFSMIEEIVQKHPIEIHGATILVDDVNAIRTLKLASGRMVCQAKGFAGYGYYKPDGYTSHMSVDDILNHEINELANVLHDKGLGLN
jgi:hypothetical protein